MQEPKAAIEFFKLSTRAVVYMMADSLQSFHQTTKATSGFDIDAFSNNVKEIIPRFNILMAFATVGLSVLAWAKVVPLVVSISLLPLVSSDNSNKSRQTRKLVGAVHGLVAAIGALLCFFYADGKPGTTWHHCNYFKLHMFDSQKYLLSITLGYQINRLFERIS